MSKEETLTNEKLNDRYSNAFSLVNSAIDIAKVRIGRGEGMDSHLASEILAAIADQDEECDGEEISVEVEQCDVEVEEEAV